MLSQPPSQTNFSFCFLFDTRPQQDELAFALREAIQEGDIVRLDACNPSIENANPVFLLKRDGKFFIKDDTNAPETSLIEAKDLTNQLKLKLFNNVDSNEYLGIKMNVISRTQTSPVPPITEEELAKKILENRENPPGIHAKDKAGHTALYYSVHADMRNMAIILNKQGAHLDPLIAKKILSSRQGNFFNRNWKTLLGGALVIGAMVTGIVLTGGIAAAAFAIGALIVGAVGLKMIEHNEVDTPLAAYFKSDPVEKQTATKLQSTDEKTTHDKTEKLSSEKSTKKIITGGIPLDQNSFTSPAESQTVSVTRPSHEIEMTPIPNQNNTPAPIADKSSSIRRP